MSIRDQYAKPKYGDGSFFKVFRQEDGDNIYRLLPPMKRLAAARIWKIYQGQHFGYRVPSKKDKGKTVLRTFMCIEKKNRNGLVTQECPECTLAAQQKALRLERFNGYVKDGRSEADIKALLENLDAWIKEHNVDRKWYVSVKNTKDEFGAFAFPHKANLNMEETFKDLREKHKIDPMDPDQGVWLNFRRSGTGPSALHPVSVITEQVDFNGRKLESPKLAPLSDTDLERGVAECPDLELETITILSFDQIKMLTETAGDPDAVEDIFRMSQRNEGSPAPVARTSTPKVETPIVAPVTPAVSLVAETPVSITAPVTSPVVAVKPVIPPAPTVDTAALSDDDFYKLYKQQ
jgi:hypothetical protein